MLKFSSHAINCASTRPRSCYILKVAGLLAKAIVSNEFEINCMICIRNFPMSSIQTFFFLHKIYCGKRLLFNYYNLTNLQS